MNTVRLQMTRQLFKYVRLINNIQRLKTCTPNNGCYSTLTMDGFASDLMDRHKNRWQKNDVSEQTVLHCTTKTTAKNNISKLSNTELDNMFTELLSKNKDKHIQEIIMECQSIRKYITFVTMKKLFKYYSQNGKPEVIVMLQNYCCQIDVSYYKHNGEFLHYLAKAQCVKGNSDTGLSILKSCYCEYDSLRSLYRVLFRDLIQDSVLHKSEATLVIFKKYVLEFSEELSDHYPLVCLWHICWASTWFSDQMLSNELLENSEDLQDIVKDKATAFSINALKDFNEDAVVRLLQTLLKYDMMSEYVAVLQLLFNYKLRNRDIRGCTEIIRNCEVLGVTLPSSQQGRYITLLIEGKRRDPEETSTKLTSKNFKLKF